MKKWFSLFAALLVLPTINSCGDDKDTDPAEQNNSQNQQDQNKPSSGNNNSSENNNNTNNNTQQPIELPAELANICEEKGAKYNACVTVGNDTWGVVCTDDFSNTRIENCTAQGLPCDTVVGIYADFKFCKCSADSECTTNIPNAKGYCIEGGNYCDFECVDGYKYKYHAEDNSFSCEKI